MTYNQVCDKNNTTSATCGVKTAYNAWAHVFNMSL